MNVEEKRALFETARRNPFWICLVVFSILAVERGIMLVRLLDVRQQLEQTTLAQARNQGAIYQTKQLETKLEGLSYELIQMGRTNATAQKIVQEFNIQWTPSPGASGARPGTNEGKP